ncbi:D-alanyl-D-alanine carboxypeptidase family protein [Pseudalkalibacillus berkeleyi]|uniref:serine-type D-Ala-D-Ala carboxypeptidase n=1 Tax=Pseudalkalibacillus berkeleyi TaxID=1069813 RepID=A0ABS9GXY2_9BACL|nr:D-alanyl-D-alanine carboxypeptidase family protein [Pseudalkalibacillus berkeleyi]MCF6137627.1 D-alanyl-D-alanine carboxypeptidase [Pseudalkalibacillus berkeleyi]
MVEAPIKLTIQLGLVILLLFILPTQNIAASSPGVHAQGAILMEQDSGRVLYGKREHEKMRIASITKIMTAILAIESGKMDETAKVTERATLAEGSSIYLKKNEKIKLEHLVYGLMLRSGNDSAVAIAEHVGGSLEGFVYLMNAKAEEIGMKNSYFSNPHGLDDSEHHYSTAYDMALLTRYAMSNSEYRKIAGTSKYRAPQDGEKWDRIWTNKNKLLRMYKYSTGGKTGFTSLAKRTLVSTAAKDGLELVAVTLNDGNDWNDHMNLFNWAFSHYDFVSIVQKGKISGLENKHYKGKVEAARTFSYPLTEEERSLVKNEITLIQPPDKGKWKNPPSRVGTLKVYLNNQQIGVLPLYMKGTYEELEEETFWNTVKDVVTKFFMITVPYG